MNISDFDYTLPETLIAQHPLEQRDHSNLLVMDKITGKISHKLFYDILDELNSGDILVRNNTKVIPARLLGKKINGSAAVEVLLLKRVNNQLNSWEALVRPGKRLKVGSKIEFGNGLLEAEIIEETISGRIIKFYYEGIFEEILDKLGTMPLPPYIHEFLKDQNRYQTVYAVHDGSSAAPTAGLHFTNELLSRIKEKKINIVDIVLHVGLGTFRPVKVDDIRKHKMHEEYFSISDEAAEKINNAKLNDKRIISVGTTTTRALESAAENGVLHSRSGWTNIFIYPGYKFQIVDALITNFHLPKSTLLMLVSALANKEYVLNAYHEAIKHHYRFFSFGDAMFIK